MIEKEIRKTITEEILNAFSFVGIHKDSLLKYTEYLKNRGLR